MEKVISNKKLKGLIEAPPSKSLTIRAVAGASLCPNKSVISNYSKCDDALAALNIIQQLGSNIKFYNDDLIIKGGKPTENTILNCRESAFCLRLFSTIAAIYDREIELTAEKSLLKRQTDDLEKVLHTLEVECKTNGGYPPIKVRGPISGGKVKIDGSKSSQLLSGLLFSLPLAKKDSVIEVTNLKSKPYIDLTLDVLYKFGIEIQNVQYELFKIKVGQHYNPAKITIEGDWTCAANFLVAGAINGEIGISNLNLNSKQGDKIIIDLLSDIGADVKTSENLINVKTKELKAFKFDAGDYPDLVPILAVLGSFCNGISKIYDVSRLGGKESSRAEIIAKELNLIGGKVKLDENNLIIENSELFGCIVNSHGDHRIAMALAVAGLIASSPITIKDSECVSKSYPNFWSNFEF